MKRVRSKFGAYTSHLAALSEDTTDPKYLLGSALFVDVLTLCAIILSKVMQSDDLNVLHGCFHEHAEDCEGGWQAHR